VDRFERPDGWQMPVRSSVANTIKEVRDNPMSGELSEIGMAGKNFPIRARSRYDLSSGG
jgi:hypothetical protein